MADRRVTLSQWKATLKKVGGPSAEAVAADPKLLAATFDVLKGLAERKYCDAALDAAGLAASGAQKTRLSPGARTGITVTSFLVSETRLTMGLRVLAGAAEGTRAFSTAGIVTMVGSTMITKVGLGLSLAGDDHETTRCVGALMEVGGNVGVTAVTWETGVGAFIGLASIAASSWNAYNECRAPGL